MKMVGEKYLEKQCHTTMESLVKKAVVWEDVENEAMSCGDEIVNKKGYYWRECQSWR